MILSATWFDPSANTYVRLRCSGRPIMELRFWAQSTTAGRRPFRNPRGIGAFLSIGMDDAGAGAVAHQTAGFDIFAQRVARGQLVAGC